MTVPPDPRYRAPPQCPSHGTERVRMVEWVRPDQFHMGRIRYRNSGKFGAPSNMQK